MTEVGSDQIGTKETVEVKNRRRFWTVHSLYPAVPRNVSLLNNLSYTPSES
jgi:ribonuclease I